MAVTTYFPWAYRLRPASGEACPASVSHPPAERRMHVSAAEYPVLSKPTVYGLEPAPVAILTAVSCAPCEAHMTLIGLHTLFSTDEKCRELLKRLRWPNGLECPRCKTT